jgi:hypothetical protein
MTSGSTNLPVDWRMLDRMCNHLFFESVEKDVVEKTWELSLVRPLSSFVLMSLLRIASLGARNYLVVVS